MGDLGLKQIIDGYKEEAAVRQKAHKKAYYEANKEKLSALHKAYREANREEISAQKRAYREANADKIAEINKQYRRANKEKMAAYRKAYYEANKEKLAIRQKAYCETRKEEIVIYKKEYREANREKILARDKEYYEANRGKRKAYCKANKDKRAAYMRERRGNNPAARIMHSLRNRLRQALKGINKSAATMNLVGCDREELIQYLESQFQEGMSWDNYGLYGWHIDHIQPCSAFDLLNSTEQKKCFHYTNLRPLWAADNMSKGAKWEAIG